MSQSPEYDPDAVLKVAAQSHPNAIAGAIAGIIRSRGHVEIQAIGPGAINQAIKAVAVARGYLRPDCIEIGFIPSFFEVTIGGQERTAMRLLVEVHTAIAQDEI
ncbi:MAG: stage V sporulation protein S [Chloroflexi bacterium]|nr:stage V sporulation protein S [Chloroflexota bacterium]